MSKKNSNKALGLVLDLHAMCYSYGQDKSIYRSNSLSDLAHALAQQCKAMQTLAYLNNLIVLIEEKHPHQHYNCVIIETF